MPRSFHKYHGKYKYLNNPRTLQGAGVLDMIQEEYQQPGSGGVQPDIRKGPHETHTPSLPREPAVGRAITGEFAAHEIAHRLTVGPKRHAVLLAEREPPKPERKQKQKGEGLLPGDALKMKLIKKMVRERKAKPRATSARKIAHVLFPQMLQALAPNAKLPKKGLDGLQRLISAKPNKAVDIILNLLEKLGHKPSAGARALVKQALEHGGSGMCGSGKKERRKKFMKDFWKGFKKGFVGTAKVALPIAAVLQPELAPLAAAAEVLL